MYMNPRRSIFANKYFLLFLCIFAVTGYSYVVMAAQLPNGTTPPSGGYAAGDSILDPGCAPGSSNCFQNIGGWGLNGNAGTTPGTNFIGTTDSQAFVIKTNNTEAMRVLADGKVGIGTTTPGYSVHVAGDFMNTFTHGDGTETRMGNNDNFLDGGEQFAGVTSVDPTAGYVYGTLNGDLNVGSGKAVQSFLLDFTGQQTTTIANEWNGGNPRIKLFSNNGINSTGSVLTMPASGGINLASTTTGGISTGIELDGSGFRYNYDGTFFTMPTVDGTNGQAMVTDGSGHFSWATVGGGSPTNPAAPDTSIQFNNTGAFGGSSDFTWDDGAKSFQVGGTVSTDNISFNVKPGLFQVYNNGATSNNSFGMANDGSVQLNSTMNANTDSFLALDDNGTALWLNDHAANTSVDIGGKVNGGNTMGILETRNLNTNMRYGFTSFKDDATFFRCNDNIPGATPCADDRAVYITNNGVSLFSNKNSDDINNYLRNSIDIVDGAITLRYEQEQGSPTTPGANTSLIMNNNLVWDGGFVGLGVTPSTGDKLEVFGDIRVGTSGSNGCLKDFAGGILGGSCSSDERLKTNIQPVGNVLDKLVQVNLVTFDWNELAQSRGFIGGIPQLGVLAQNVESVFPDLVIFDKDGYRQVNYTRLNLLNLQAIRELDIKIKNIENFDTIGDSSFKTTLMSWLGSSTNGLGNVSSDKVTTHQLCVDGQCLTENDVRQLIELKNQISGQNQGSQGQLNNDPVIPTTPEETPPASDPEVISDTQPQMETELTPEPQPTPDPTPAPETDSTITQ